LAAGFFVVVDARFGAAAFFSSAFGFAAVELLPPIFSISISESRLR
jgi:hypothetical protein